MTNAITCGVCSFRFKKGQARKINSCYEAYFQKIDGRKLSTNDSICMTCRIQYSRNKGSPNVKENKEPKTYTILPFKCIGKTKACCVICKRTGKGITLIPSQVRIKIFVNQGVLVPLGVRCCKTHLSGKNIKNKISLDTESLKTTGKLSTEELIELLKVLCNVAKTPLISKSNSWMTILRHHWSESRTVQRSLFQY